MIIPMRCFTCGTVIADKWQPFVKMAIDEKKKSDENVDSELDIQYIDVKDEGRLKKSIEGKVLDKLEMHKYCCRRMFLGNVHLIPYI